MQFSLTLLSSLVLFYILAALAAHLFGGNLIFPAPPPEYEPDRYPLRLTTENGLNIVAHHLEAPEAEFTILYSHGNAEDMEAAEPSLQEIADHGYNAFGYEYPGYGHSEGKPGVSNTFMAAEAAMKYLLEDKGIPPEKILLYGRSLGSGPTHYLAENYPVGGMILEGAFVSTYRVMTHIPLFPGDKFQNLKRMKELNLPVLVIHGTMDLTVPFWHGKALYNAATGPKQRLWVEGAGHNDIKDHAEEEYWKAIDSFATFVKKNSTPETHLTNE